MARNCCVITCVYVLSGKTAALAIDDRLFAAYIFYGCILVLKMSFMSIWTVKQRIKNRAPPSPEDYGPKKKDRPVPINEDVERSNRAHRNDLENIPIFLIVALLYMLSNLPHVRGIWCLRIFTAARILHTVAYLNSLSKPRAMGFLIGAVCIAVLGVSVLYSAVTTGAF